MSESDYGSWTIECTRGFTPAELAQALSGSAELVELRYVGALSRAQSTFVTAASEPKWVHLTFWDPVETGMVLTVERDTSNPPAPFVVKAETSIATDRFGDTPERRVIVGALAKKLVNVACEKLGAKITSFELDTSP
jgi:hypothetical protein